MRRYIYIIVGIVVVAALAIVAIFLFKNNSGQGGAAAGGTGSLPGVGTQSNPSGATGGTSAGQSMASTSAAGNAVFNMLYAGPVLDYFMNASGTITAINADGTVASVSGSQTSVLSSSTISAIITTGFSFDGKKLFVSFGNPNNPQTNVFDVASRSWLSLPQGILSPVWSPSDYRIAYFTAGSAAHLTLSTLDVSSAKNKPVLITTFAAEDLDVAWTSKSQFVFYDKPSTYSAGSMWSFNSATQAILPVVLGEPGLESVWNGTGVSSSAVFGLTFTGNVQGQGGSLQFVDSSGNLSGNASFLTLPTKCTFATSSAPSNPAGNAASTTASSTAHLASSSSATSGPMLVLYCGIPRENGIFTNAALPDSYNEKALFTSDDIYEINLAAGDTMEPLWTDSSQNMDVSDPKTADGMFLFINRYDQKLYGLSLSSQ